MTIEATLCILGNLTARQLARSACEALMALGRYAQVMASHALRASWLGYPLGFACIGAEVQNAGTSYQTMDTLRRQRPPHTKPRTCNSKLIDFTS